MATMSNPCVSFDSRVAGVSIKSCSSSTFRFKVKSGYSVSSSFGELFGGDGGAVTVGISSRVVVPLRSLRLRTSQHQSTSTSRRCFGKLGQTTLRALVDETRTTSTEEKQYSAFDVHNDEELLKKKAARVVQQLAGTCIFLVGMMGSGKTTVGRGVSEALEYFFFDSDKLVEEAAGGTTVAEMFRAGREEDFRNAETEVLEQLATMSRLVVATGGGAVVRPQNWGHMRHGITVWLDVPVDCLAHRVVAVGCHSRPLLGVQAEDSAYKQALERLTRILHERHHMYKNADVVVSVAEIARERDLDIETVTPTMIAVEVLEEIAQKLEGDGSLSRR